MTRHQQPASAPFNVVLERTQASGIRLVVTIHRGVPELHIDQSEVTQQSIRRARTSKLERVQTDDFLREAASTIALLNGRTQAFGWVDGDQEYFAEVNARGEVHATSRHAFRSAIHPLGVEI